MKNKLHIVIEAFLVGMLFEYILRVEASFFPIAMIILLIGSIILDFVIDYYTNKKNTLLKEIEKNTQQIIINGSYINEIPKGWIVTKAGQTSKDLLWYIKLVNIDDVYNHIEQPRQIYLNGGISYDEILKKAINKINLKELKNI